MKIKTTHKMFLRSFFIQSFWNFGFFQNVGFAYIMVPALEEIYKDNRKEFFSALGRYLESYNTNPIIATFSFGVLHKLEEKIANETNDLDKKRKLEEEWRASKNALTTTIASIGDRFFFDTLKSLTLAFCIVIWIVSQADVRKANIIDCVNNNKLLLGVVLAFILYNVVSIYIRNKGLVLGERSHHYSCFGLKVFDWERYIKFFKQAGTLLTIIIILYNIYDKFIDRQYIDHPYLTGGVGLSVFFMTFYFKKRSIPTLYLYMIVALVFTLISDVFL